MANFGPKVYSATKTTNDARALTTTLVGTDTSDTLTNKTLTSPTINSATIGSSTLNSATVNNAATNYPVLTSPKEVWTINSGATSTTTQYDVLTQSVIYNQSSATGNFSINFRGNSSTTLSAGLAVGSSYTVTLLNTNGTTPYVPSSITIDGGSALVKGTNLFWVGGNSPSGNASAVDAYQFTIVKTAATPTYAVFASVAKYA